MTLENVPGPKRPQVLVLSFSRIIRDPRVLRQISLYGEFADVISCGYGPSPEGVARHIEVPEDLPAWRSNKVKTALYLGARLYGRLYFRAARIRLVQERVPPGTVDVVVANDAIAVPLAVSLRPRKGVHADLHEYAPKQMENDRMWRLLIGPLMDWACRKFVTEAHSVSTVAKGIAVEYASVYGIPEPSVVPNAAAYDHRFAPTPVGSPLRLVHTGAAGRGRKIEVMIDAVRRANEHCPGTATLDLVLVPGDQRYIDELAVLAEAVSDGSVRMRPPVPFEQIVPMLHEYDIGMFICPPSTFNLRHALPNKLFEFVQARLAILIGPSPEMEAIVMRHGLGVVSAGFDAESVAEALNNLNEPDVRRMKEASHAAARSLSAESLIGPWSSSVKALLEASDD
jgi:hypothetical protein